LYRSKAIPMATDPVCLMIVDEDNVKFTSTYRDQKYYFCCNWCKTKFDENPKRYFRMATDMSVDLGGSCD
jgi:YHS domain-containing protein